MLENIKLHKISNLKKIFLILMIATILMPWFSIGSEVSSLWGLTIAVKQLIVIPIIYLVYYLIALEDKNQNVYITLAVISSVSIIGLYLTSFLNFRSFMWTIFDKDIGINLAYSFQCSRIPFWISAVAATAFFVMLIMDIHFRRKNN